MGESVSKRILDSALSALLKGLELSPWVSVPATFVAELSKRFQALPADQKQELQSGDSQSIAAALPSIMSGESAPDPQTLASAICEATMRGRVLDYLYGLTTPALNELISRIEGARENVSDTAARRTQVAQFVDWVESSEGPKLPKLIEVIGPDF